VFSGRVWIWDVKGEKGRIVGVVSVEVEKGDRKPSVEVVCEVAGIEKKRCTKKRLV